MAGSAWAAEGGRRCTEGGRSSDYRRAIEGRREGPWVRDPRTQRQRERERDRETESREKEGQEKMLAVS